ncbi:MAG: NAD(P)-dependent alcohol dehydrogenase [Candidatus Heimdallarchaeota archaeon]|nr:NAD(P)-dependent alcohol dehydrogenase [Candidatus Heimdallarchaeota archaeon]
MKAVVYEKYGPPEVLKLVDVEKPTPKDNELLVKVHGTTVNAAVVNGRKGKHPASKFFTFALRLIYGIRKPRKPILGYEFGGVVESVGKDVTLFKKGDEIFGTTTMLKQGSYAEYVCVPEKWKSGVVEIKPANLTFEEAAAVPVAGMAVLQIIRKANIQKGQKVLVSGASGSTGSFAVLLAKYFGAEVTGVCSTDKIEMVKSLGADKVIDYTKEDFTQSGEKYDVVFESTVKVSDKKCKSVLKPNGVFLTIKSMTSETTEKMTYLRDLIEKGKIKPYIDRSYPLEEMVEAHKYVDEGHKKGNVVITIVQNDNN